MVKQDIQSTTTKATTLKPLYPLYIPIISPLKPLYPHYPHLMVHDYIRAISPLYYLPVIPPCYIPMKHQHGCASGRSPRLPCDGQVRTPMT